MSGWTIAPEPVEASGSLLREYFTDMVSSYYGRPATEAQVDAALAEDPSNDLACFLVGRYAGVPSGCVGLRLIGPGMAELTRMFVHPRARRTGGGHALPLETIPVELGDGRKVKIRRYPGGDVSFELSDGPYVMRQCFLPGAGDHADIRLSPGKQGSNVPKTYGA